MDARQKATELLAKKHYHIEPGITEIRTICSGSVYESEEPIRLLEVNADTVPTGIMPLAFDAAPASGIPFPSVIVEVTPIEYQQILASELSLPYGWTLGPVLPKPNVKEKRE
jgi:hypothetical protein